MQTLNSQKFKGKVLSVTIAGARGGGRRDTPDAGLSRKADARARSIRVAGIPADSQEALIQQFFEKLTAKGAVKSIEWTPGQQPPADAVVEFSDVAVSGPVPTFTFDRLLMPMKLFRLVSLIAVSDGRQDVSTKRCGLR